MVDEDEWVDRDDLNVAPATPAAGFPAPGTPRPVPTGPPTTYGPARSGASARLRQPNDVPLSIARNLAPLQGRLAPPGSEARGSYRRFLLDDVPSSIRRPPRPVEPEAKRPRTDEAEALLVGPSRASELRYEDLSPKDKKLCEAAMAKEWAKWEQFGSTRKITWDEWEEAVRQKVNVVGTRWVLTRKPTGEIKARLVIQGCQEKSCDIRSDSPTGSLGAFWSILAWAAQPGWGLRGYDAASAYLQSEGIDRMLLIRMPGQQPPPGTIPYQVLRALGSIYGTKDAGRAWYLHLRKILISRGWVESKLERCLFYLRDPRGETVCVLFVHVDDILAATKNGCKQVDDELSALTKKLHLDRRDGDVWTYCGKQIAVSPDSYMVSCPKTIAALEPIPLSRERAREEESP